MLLTNRKWISSPRALHSSDLHQQVVLRAPILRNETTFMTTCWWPLFIVRDSFVWMNVRMRHGSRNFKLNGIYSSGQPESGRQNIVIYYYSWSYLPVFLLKDISLEYEINNVTVLGICIIDRYWGCADGNAWLGKSFPSVSHNLNRANHWLSKA